MSKWKNASCLGSQFVHNKTKKKLLFSVNYEKKINQKSGPIQTFLILIVKKKKNQPVSKAEC